MIAGPITASDYSAAIGSPAPCCDDPDYDSPRGFRVMGTYRQPASKACHGTFLGRTVKPPKKLGVKIVRGHEIFEPPRD